MLLGYNTNGLAHHDPLDAIRLLASIGYQSVALSIDHATLNPYGPDYQGQVAAVAMLLEEYGMRSVIETGARFLLDPMVKHEPTLLTADAGERARRVEFLKHAVDIAGELGSDCVSIWSGILRDKIDDSAAFARLEWGLREVLDYAAKRSMVLGFEPEPGMFIDTMAKYEQLIQRIDAPQLRLTLDIGHLHCLGELPIADQIRRWHERLVNVHIEDMRQGTHEHLMFGEGEIDFPPVIAALKEVGYAGGVHVELSRHSHEGPTAARRAFDFLRLLL